MSTTGVKIVLDTNILIAIIGKKSPHRWIFDKIIKGGFHLCVSSDVLWECEEILTQKAGSTATRNIIDFLLISPYVHSVDIFYFWQLIEADPDDNKFIDCTVSADAYCLVTNDKHFNVVKEIDFPKIKISSLKEFEKEFKP